MLRPVTVLCVFSLCVTAFAQEPRLATWVDAKGHVLALDFGTGPVVLHTSSAQVIGAAWHPVSGSGEACVTWTELDDGQTSDWCLLAQDGRTFSTPIPMDYTLKLRFGEFDPLRSAAPAVPQELRAAASSRLAIVQFWSQTTDAQIRLLAQVGAKRHLYLAHHASVVEADGVTLAALKAMPCVRWVGAFHPAYKLDETLLSVLAGRHSAPARFNVNALSTGRGREAQMPALQLLTERGAAILHSDPQTHLFAAELDRSTLVALVQSDAVQWVDPRGEPGVDMDIARTFHGATYVDTLGFDGTGVRGEDMDVGIETTHPEFIPPPIIHGASPANNHGTCTYGEVFANGTDPMAKGILHNGTGVAAVYTTFVGGTRYAHTGDCVNPASAIQVVFQTNSWGGTLTTSYTSVSQDMDLALFDHDFVITQSQSNAGTQSSRPEAWAKNIISVGGISHGNTATKADDVWTGASIGPAADGRLKPDVASFYDNIYCTDQVGAAGYAAGSYYAGFNGTSGATPIVAGCVGILHQMWHQGIFGNPTAGSVFASRPHAATAKALIINTATQWTFVGAAANLSRVKQGWGHPDLATLYNDRNKMLIVNETDVLPNLGLTGYTVTVATGEPMFQATLVWRDRAGTTSATQHRINNLDLKVVAPNGTIYYGNNGLAAGNTSTSGGSANIVDTVENVILTNPAAGVWTITVTAAQLNQDGHAATGALDSAYALVVRGGLTGPPPPPPFSLEFTSPSGPGSVHFGINSIPAGTSEGFTLFSFNTSAAVGSGAFLGLNADLLSITCLQQPVAPGSLIHWAWPEIGLYPAVDISLPAGSISFPAGFGVDSVGIALGLGYTFVGATPVVRLIF